jgi:hypothetical protein
MSRACAIVTALLLASTAPLSAQRPDNRQEGEVARLTKTRDSLVTLWREAAALVQFQDSMTHAASLGRLDTVEVHGIRVAANGGAELIRGALQQIWPVYDSLYGDEAVRLGGKTLVFQFVQQDSIRGRQLWGQPIPRDMSEEGFAKTLKGTLSIGRADSALATWMPGAVTIPLFGLEREAIDAYITLVASSPEVGRRCFDGDLRACAAALRLNDADSATLLAAWPTALERQDVAMKLEAYLRHRRNLEGLLECRAGSDAACGNLIRTVEPYALPHPLQVEARGLLVHLALYRGGRQAYRRLISDTTSSIGQRLAQAAGIPLDTLLQEWRAVVLAHRPAPVSLPVSTVLASMGWIILLGYLSTRSSRWRLG